MGEVFNFEEYLTAKKTGISIEALRSARKVAEEMIKEFTPEELAGEYYHYDMDPEDEDWPPGYPFILKEDSLKPEHQMCKHFEWEVMEEDYQVRCTSCNLNAWSAPW